MTNTDPIEGQAIDALDAILPRRDPRYQDALTYLTVYLAIDPSTRRLALRALKASSPDPEATEAAPPAAGGAPESGEDKEGAAAGTRTSVNDVPASTAGTQSGQPRLWCHGKACEEQRGIEIHRDDPSCGKFHPPKRVAHAR